MFFYKEIANPVEVNFRMGSHFDLGKGVVRGGNRKFALEGEITILNWKKINNVFLSNVCSQAVVQNIVVGAVSVS
jgi:hypothetical protein